MSQLLDLVLAELKKARGVDLRGYRIPLLTRRLAARMDRIGYADADTYLHLLQTDPTECDQLIDTIAINVSTFFRDPIVFELVAQNALPDIIERKCKAGSQEIRIWSAGCSGGQEAYSLAILLDRALGDQSLEWGSLIFGTDIDRAVLQAAEKGQYRREDLMTTQLGIIDSYFEVQGDAFEVIGELRRNVRFSWDDLTRIDRSSPVDSVFGGFDLVTCRNLLIYLTPAKQIEVVTKLCRSLVSGGYLILGSAESLPEQFRGQLVAVDHRNRIFCKT